MAPGFRRTALLVVVALAAATARAEGMVLPVALVADFIWSRRWREGIWSSVVFVVVLGPLLWWLLSASGIAGETYNGDLKFRGKDPQELYAVMMAKRIFVNVTFYPTHALPRLLAIPLQRGSLPNILVDALVITTALAAGGFAAFRRFRLGALALLVCAGLLAVWPWHLERFLVPFLPLIVLVFVLGLHVIGSIWGERAATIVVVVVTALSLGVLVPTNFDVLQHRLQCERGRRSPDPKCVAPEVADFLEGTGAVAATVPKDAHVMAGKSAPLYLYTGRRSVRTNALLFVDTLDFIRQLHVRGVDYVLLTDVHPTERKIALKLRSVCRGNFRLVRTLPRYILLLQLLPQGSADARPVPAGTPDEACDAIDNYIRLRPVPEGG
jgi:hypothetical protein